MRIVKNEFSLCMPLTGKNMQELEAEINAGLASDCDFFEWRRDYFTAESEQESTCLKRIRFLIKDKGLIYTFRSNCEGGQSKISDRQRLAMIKSAIETELMDYIDIELDNLPYFLAEIETVLKPVKVKKILSYHDFKQLPKNQTVTMVFDKMRANQADVLKIALRPGCKNDLRRLINLTLTYGQTIDEPMIAIAMGDLGKISRIAPEFCGGSLSFASGTKKTAPGQLSPQAINDQRKALGL